MFRLLLNKILPERLMECLRRQRTLLSMLSAYYYDCMRYYRYSASNGCRDLNALRAKIIREYHILEKGLTMPEPKIEFGTDVAASLAACCSEFCSVYGGRDEQVRHAISVLQEYTRRRGDNGSPLPEILSVKFRRIEQLACKYDIKPSCQQKVTDREYFRYVDCSFERFSASRRSVRNYSSKPISLKIIGRALSLALNAPSACNRQPCKCYVCSGRERIRQVLDVQNGNRGFGHLADKLIIIVADLSAFAHVVERNQAYIDGGIFAMNVLYALHHFGIAACMLNCGDTPDIDKARREVCKIGRREVFISIIACGYAPEEFSVASSPRFGVKDKVSLLPA